MTPRSVDHARRRSELTAAAVDLVAGGGRQAATVRAVAAATGWSVGTVQHYVPSSAALDALLLDHVAGRVQERVARRVREGVEQDLGRLELTARMLEEVLPLDADRLTEHRIWAAVYLSGPGAGGEEAWAWTGQRMFHRQVVLLLGGAAAVPDHPGELEPAAERWAAHLHAFVDGLRLRVAAGAQDATGSREHLRAFLGVVAAAAATAPGPRAPTLDP